MLPVATSLGAGVLGMAVFVSVSSRKKKSDEKDEQLEVAPSTGDQQDDPFVELYRKLDRIKAGEAIELTEEDQQLIRYEIGRKEKVGKEGFGMNYLQKNMEGNEFQDLQGYIDPNAEKHLLDRFLVSGLLFLCFCTLLAMVVAAFFVYHAWKKDDKVINAFMNHWHRFSRQAVAFVKLHVTGFAKEHLGVDLHEVASRMEL